MKYQNIRKRMSDGELIILDGGTGTELQKRGVVMDPGAWCGPVSLDNQSMLEEIHLDYIHAGADIITANTFASSPIMLREAGFEDRFVEINTSAIEAALSARQRSGNQAVLVAGSLSHMVPMMVGSDTRKGDLPSVECMTEAFEQQAVLIRDLGCDLILLEMMYCSKRIPLVLEAAKKSGLPLWAGFSIREDDDGKLVARGDDCSAQEVFTCIAPESVDVMGVMHTSAQLTGLGLAELRRFWSGPLCAYPDSGVFKMPNWQFEQILTPHEFLDFSQAWFDLGVRVLGGCCGLGPEHISPLQKLQVSAL